MRLAYRSLTPAAVHHEVHRSLSGVLSWTGYKRSVTAREVIDLLILVAAGGLTLFAVVRRRFGFCPETGRKAVHSQLPDLPTLTAGLVRALHGVLLFSRRDRRRRWRVAIDTHGVPFYGDPKTPGVSGGHKKQGTHYSFAYATAVLTHKRRRYTVGLTPCGGLKPHEVVAALFAQLDAHGLGVLGVALDSAFDSGETILFLQARKVHFAVPLRRKGKGPNRRNDCFSWGHGTIGTATWVAEQTRRTVAVRVLVWARPGAKAQSPEGSPVPEAGRKGAEPAAAVRVLAFGGWGERGAVTEARRARLARQRYRERFGIETSYRQKNQMSGWTTSRDPAYRLLLEGIGYLVRQVWVLFAEAIAWAQRLSPGVWVGCFPGAVLLEWLTEHLQTQYPADRCIPLQPEGLL